MFSVIHLEGYLMKNEIPEFVTLNMRGQKPYKETPEYVKNLEADNSRWLAEIKRLRETIAEKNEEIRELSKFQLYCYKNTDFKG